MTVTSSEKEETMKQVHFTLFSKGLNSLVDF